MSAHRNTPNLRASPRPRPRPRPPSPPAPAATSAPAFRSTEAAAAISRPVRSDRPSALRRSALLRTGRAALTASGSSRSRGLGGGQSSGLVAVLAVGVYETVFSLVGRGVRGHDRDRVAGGGEPSFPVLGARWLLIDAEQRGFADRAATGLGSVEPQAGVVDRQGRFAPPRGPVVAQRRVIG
jgi:hypothetical protein